MVEETTRPSEATGSTSVEADSAALEERPQAVDAGAALPSGEVVPHHHLGRAEVARPGRARRRSPRPRPRRRGRTAAPPPRRARSPASSSQLARERREERRGQLGPEHADGCGSKVSATAWPRPASPARRARARRACGGRGARRRSCRWRPRSRAARRRSTRASRDLHPGDVTRPGQQVALWRSRAAGARRGVVRTVCPRAPASSRTGRSGRRTRPGSAGTCRRAASAARSRSRPRSPRGDGAPADHRRGDGARAPRTASGRSWRSRRWRPAKTWPSARTAAPTRKRE